VLDALVGRCVARGKSIGLREEPDRPSVFDYASPL
jgi:hypothetical protein